MPILLAAFSAFFYGSADTSYRFALRTITPVHLALVFSLSQLAVMAALVLGRGIEHPLDGRAVLWFALGGVFNPAMMALSFFAAVRRAGSARSSTVKATAPIFAVIAAVLILGERPAWPQYVGVVSVAAGVMSLCAEGIHGEWPLSAIFFALIAAFSSGFSSVLFKLGLLRTPDPVFGLLIALSACSAVIVPVWFLQFRRTKSGEPSPPLSAWNNPDKLWAYGWSLFASMLSVCGNLFLFFALGIGAVSTVAPLVQCAPLIVLFYSAVFLRSVERPTWALFAGVVLILSGAYLVTAFRTGP